TIIIENRFHRNHPSKSRMWDVEDDQLHTARMYTIDKGRNHIMGLHTQHIGQKST
nr:hypothetical protein [Tanacetum cinerariifolium]